jgi:hypothetical protein
MTRERLRTITITLTIELTGEEQHQISENSIERVYNNAIQNAEYVMEYAKDQYDRERANINLEDWEELKRVTTKIWNLTRNEIFKHYNPERSNI